MFSGRRGHLVAVLMLPLAVFLVSCNVFHHKSAPAGMGQEVVDGKFAFIVNGISTSPTFGDAHARGVWVVVSTAIRNIGTTALPFDMTAQTLKESDGRGHTAGAIEPTSVTTIDPGLQLSVKLAFDVTPGVRPTKIWLHESDDSPGVPVTLTQPTTNASPRPSENDRATP
jgi:hypothetical protein